MTGLPLQCLGRCGRTFSSEFFGFSGDSRAYVQDVIMTCPTCGGDAVMASGGYVTGRDGEVVAALPKSEFDAELLRRAGILVQELLDEGLSAQKIVDRVAEEVSPEVARKLLQGKTRKQISRWAGGIGLFLLAGVADRALDRADEALLPHDDRPAIVQFSPPEDSEGTITKPDGTVVRWQVDNSSEPGATTAPPPAEPSAPLAPERPDLPPRPGPVQP